MNKNLSISYVDIKYLLSILFICGWLLPKILIGSFYVGIQELAAILLILFKFKINRLIFRVFYADLFFAVFLFILGLLYLAKEDIEGFFIGCRTLLFVIAALSFTNTDYINLEKLLKSVIYIELAFIFYSITRIMLNIFFNSFDILNFFYGNDSYRVKAPFERIESASSQVPIGYMLAMILCIPIIQRSRFKSSIFILGAIGTTSRASILSIVIVYFKKIRFKKITAVFSILFLLALVYVIYLKSFTAGSGELDGSTNKRLFLYMSSFQILLEHPTSIIGGFGLSSKSLAEATGEGFYESFFINSLMQGGLILFLGSVWIFIKSVYYDYKYGIYSISIVIFFGNAVGGSNYFSMYAYPLMVLIICLALKKHNQIPLEKNITLNNN